MNLARRLFKIIGRSPKSFYHESFLLFSGEVDVPQMYIIQRGPAREAAGGFKFISTKHGFSISQSQPFFFSFLVAFPPPPPL